MSTFKAYFKKEIIEAIRQYKYLIIIISLLFFAIADPIMLKALPSILKGETNMNLASLFKVNRQMALQNYIKDLFQIGNIIIVFTLSGIVGKEIYEEKLVFPYSKGVTPIGIILSKALNYIIFTTVITFLGFIINSYYAGILFKDNGVVFSGVMKSALCISLFYIFNIIFTEFISSLFKKSMASGIIVLFINYFMLAFKSLKSFYNYLPVKFIDIANTFSTNGIEKPIFSLIICSCIFIFLSIYRMNKVEVI